MKLSQKWAIVTIAVWVAMGGGGIVLDIITGATSDAAIWISILAIPGFVTGIHTAFLQEQNR